MGNSSKKEENVSSNAKDKEENEMSDQIGSMWFPSFNEFCFGDSPDEINKKIPQQFSTVEWTTLPIAFEYKLDEVRYMIIPINKFDDSTKFIPPHIYISPSTFICLMFLKKRLFRISLRLIYDERASNYRNIIQSYARAIQTSIDKNQMFHYEDQTMFYYSNEESDHTSIEIIEKGHVIPDGNVWNPFPSDQILENSMNSSNHKYSYDIMISYSHQDKQICHQIYHELIKDGFKVWMDLENMYGSTIERMAEAIQNSQFIIICMSHKYQTSPYCKTEGQYTYKLQRSFIPCIVEKGYKPYDWLGALLGLRMYIDFTKYDFPTAYQKLLKEIQTNKLRK